MTKKPNIAIVAGGNSSEFVVSLISGDNVFAAIDKNKFDPWLVHMKGNEWSVIENGIKIAGIDKSDFSFSLNNTKIRFDYASINIHGTPGEDGILQGYFDLLKIPYSTSNVHSSSLTFNKWFCNNYLQNFGIHMARSVILRKGDHVDTSKIIDKLGLPVFVKPNAGGSSFGITKVKTEEELKPAIHKAREESRDALVEEFIEGTEYTCGLVKLKDQSLIFPVTEVIPKNEFFDYEAKYTPGVTEEITPARLPEHLFKKCQELSTAIYDHCHCSGIVRIDYILRDNTFWFLEVNTTPGMTATSFIPQQINAM
jgi:D-alanine-D-alanine ligase